MRPRRSLTLHSIQPQGPGSAGAGVVARRPPRPTTARGLRLGFRRTLFGATSVGNDHAPSVCGGQGRTKPGPPPHSLSGSLSGNFNARWWRNRMLALQFHSQAALRRGLLLTGKRYEAAGRYSRNWRAGNAVRRFGWVTGSSGSQTSASSKSCLVRPLRMMCREFAGASSASHRRYRPLWPPARRVGPAPQSLNPAQSDVQSRN